jgi:hypothetical protein
MGGKPWNYFVPFEASVEAALEKLRQRVFEAGDFFGSEMNPATLEEAMENMGEAGTASILDMMQISDSPELFSVYPLSDSRLKSLFGTTQPTHQMVEANLDVYDDVNRGLGTYIVVYKDGKPNEYFFAGYSFD